MIVVPVLGRPGNAAPLVESALSHAGVQTEVLFVCSPGDYDQIAACKKTGQRTIVIHRPPERGDYARKINIGASATLAPWVFTGADDLRFTDGWDITAIAEAERSRAGVVGTIDMCNPKTNRAVHSTHSLIASWYVREGTIDQPGAIYHEGYWHNFVDDELIATARMRRQYAPSRAIVQHLHPMRGTSPNDDTYRRGQLYFADDRALFQRRRALITKGRRVPPSRVRP